MHYDQNSGRYHLGEKSGDVSKASIWEDFSVTIYIPNEDENGEKVQYVGGRKYSVVITVYGKSSILVDVLRPTMWENGGDIDAGGD